MGTEKYAVRAASEAVQPRQEKVSYVYTGEQLLNYEIKEVPMLLKPLFPQVGVVALAGSSDTGKSAFLRQFACAVVLGHKEFLGFLLQSRHGKALYISTEDDALAISALLQRQKSVNCVNGDYKKLRFIFDTANLLAKIEKELQKENVDCVIVDAFADLFDGEMNAVNSVRSFLQLYADLAKRYECLIIFLHHTGKRTEFLAPSKDNLLGSQGFEGKMRMVAEIRIDPTDPEKRHLCIVKGNYISPEFKQASFVLHFDSDTLQFKNLGDRVDFSELVKRKPAENEDWQRAKEQAIKLGRQRMPIRLIVNYLAASGLPGKKSAVAEWLKEDPESSLGGKRPLASVDDKHTVGPKNKSRTYYEPDPEEPFDD